MNKVAGKEVGSPVRRTNRRRPDMADLRLDVLGLPILRAVC